MARTKQTARKSIGGKAPRKTLTTKIDMIIPTKGKTVIKKTGAGVKGCA